MRHTVRALIELGALRRIRLSETCPEWDAGMGARRDRPARRARLDGFDYHR